MSKARDRFKAELNDIKLTIEDLLDRLDEIIDDERNEAYQSGFDDGFEEAKYGD
jgi:flagellar biosynthesis/type III secretory pathway protein FliH